MLDKIVMKIEKTIRLSQLFDAYGPILSESQREVLQDFLFFDLTGTEIAENRNISRQAVKDSIKKAEARLEELESKLHFVDKIETLTKEIENLKKGK